MGRTLLLSFGVLFGTAASASLPEGTEVVVQPDGFVFVATPKARAAARTIAESAEGIRSRQARSVGRDYDGVTEVRVAHSRASFQALQAEGVLAPSWAAGIAMPSRNLIVLNVSGGPGRRPLEKVLAHEVSHISLGRLAPGGFPRWFLEGMATYHADEWDFARSTTLASAVVGKDIIPLDDLNHGWPVAPADVNTAYAQSIDFVSWMFREHGPDAIPTVVSEVIDGARFGDALQTATGLELWKLEKQWVESMRLRYTWVPAITSTGFIWGLTSLLFAVAFVRKRRRQKAQMDQMDDLPDPEMAEVIPFPGTGNASGSAGLSH